jgi:hypothetical protein
LIFAIFTPILRDVYTGVYEVVVPENGDLKKFEISIEIASLGNFKGATTLSIKTLSITILSITTFGIIINKTLHSA